MCVFLEESATFLVILFPKNCCRLSKTDKPVIIYLGLSLLTTSCNRPRRHNGTSSPAAARQLASCLVLLPVGFAWPVTLLPPPVVSYTAVSPSRIKEILDLQYTSLLHLPSGFPARLLAGTMLYGVRTFLSFTR